MDLALNNLQRLICHKTQQTKQTKPNEICCSLIHQAMLCTAYAPFPQLLKVLDQKESLH